MGSKHDVLRGKLTNAIVEVCRQEAFYFQELRIEGTVCLVSDGSSVLIAQITEQIGDKSLEFPDEADRCHQDLPVLDSSHQSVSNNDGASLQDEETKLEEKEDVQVDSTVTQHEKSPNRLSAAMYTKERAEGRYKCPFCPKKYRFKHSLKDHINTHTGKKPHVCKHCAHAFTHLASLCAHIRRKHSQLMPTEHRCSICKELFMNEQSLKQHHTYRHKNPRTHTPEDSILSTPQHKEGGDSVEQILAAEFASHKDEPAPGPAQDVSQKDKSSLKTCAENEGSISTKDIKAENLIPGLKQYEGNPPQPTLPLDNNLPNVNLNQAPGMLLPDFNQSITHPLPPTSLFQASLDFQQQALAMGIGSQPPIPMNMGVGHMFTGLSPLPFPFPSPSPTRGQPPLIPDLVKVSLPPSILPTSTPVVSSPSPYGDFHRTEDGKFQCPYCEKAYNFKHTLKDHINKHTGKRPHVCKHCGDSFTHLASLCNHIKRRHEEKIPEEFQCDICHERFMNYQSVKQHYTWRHKNEKFPKRFSYTGGAIGKRTLTGGFQQQTPESPGCDQGSTPGSAASMPTEQEIIDEIAGELSMSDSMATVTTASSGTPMSTPPAAQSAWQNKFTLHPSVQSVFPGQALGAESISIGNHGNPELKGENSLPPTLPDDIAAVRGFEEQMPLPDDCDMQALLDCDIPPGQGQGQGDYSSEPSSPPKNILEYFESVDIQTEHGHYKYKCKVCSNLFKIRNSLHEHVNSHLGRKPHICSYCGDSFTHHSTLHNHVKNKHTYQTREEKEASFRHQCGVCQRRFRYPSEMERHFKANPDHELAPMETEGLS